jgi:DNA replication protein DnaC
MESLRTTLTGLSFETQARKPAEAYQCEDCGAIVQPIVIDVLGGVRILPGICVCVKERRTQEELQRQNAERIHKIERLFSLAQLGPRFQEATFEGWHPRQGTEQAHRAAKTLVDEWDYTGRTGDSLMLIGPVGTGKSHLAAAVINTLIPQGVACIFQPVPELFQRLNATYSRESRETEAQLLHALQEADLLVLDDVGAEKPSPANETRLYQIVDARYRGKKPMLITSNLDVNQLRAQVGERTIDRLIEMCQIVQLEATSYRRIVAAQKRESQLAR